MSLPPNDIPPHELWALITQLPRPYRTIDFPRNGADGKPIGQLAIRVLTQEEQILAAAEAERFTKKAIKDLPKGDEAKTGYDSVYQNTAAVEVLFAACRQKDDPDKAFFPSREALRRFLTPDEVGVLMVSYYTVQSEIGPIVAHLSEEELDAWIKRLAEGGSRFPLDLLSWDAAKDLAFSLACRLYKLTTDSTSPGSLPESTQTTETEPQLNLLPSP